MKRWQMQFNVSSNSEKLDISNFEMTIDNFSKLDEVSKSPTFTTQNGKTTWQIIVEVAKEAKKSRFALNRTDYNTYNVNGLLMFEVGNDKKEIFWRDFVECFYPGLHWASPYANSCYCDYIEMPSHQYSVTDIRGKPFTLPSDQIIIKGQVLVKEWKFSQSRSIEENMDQLMRDYKNLYHSHKFSDVEFKFPNGKIPAHKSILSTRSPVFRTIFQQNSFQTTIEITGVEKSTFETFLVFLYSGIVESKDIEEIAKVYSLATKYEINSLRKTCSSILVSELSAKTAIRTLELADKEGDFALKDVAMDFVCEKFAQVSKTEEWNKLITSDPQFATIVLRKVSKNFEARK